MRAGLAIGIVMVAAASAAAEPWSFELPGSFKEKAGASDVHIEHARKAATTVDVDAKVYTDRDVQLTRIVWRWKPTAPPTRSALDTFDRELVAADAAKVTHPVSDVRTWYGEQMVVDAFDEVDKTRVYHRRFYAVDRSGVVHLFWLICTGPADQIATCEEAQRTMRLAVTDAAPVPQGAPIAERTLPTGPWSFVLPDGYVEATDKTEAMLRSETRTQHVISTDGRVYRSPAGDVQLLAMTQTLFRGFSPTRADLDGIIAMLLDDAKAVATKHVSDWHRFTDGVLVADQVDQLRSATIHQRHMIAIDSASIVYFLSVTCAGPGDRLSDCEAAQESMTLKPINHIDAEKLPANIVIAKRRGVGAWSISNMIGAGAVVALIVGLSAWIYQSAQRRDRRRRRR